jgi:ribosomal protein S18 acetylase RimI-like enzyme
MDFELKLALTTEDFNSAKTIIKEYGESLDFDLSFQNFYRELTELKEHYFPPIGVLVLADFGSDSIGCVGVTKWRESIAELKRFYVKPLFRGSGIGNRLLDRALEKVTALGYKKIRLDTIPNMKAAQRLYLKYGFYFIEPYCYHPIKGTLYMEKILK